MPETLWAVIEGHAPTTPGKDRSGYIRALVEADLAKNGKLPGSSHAEILAAIELIGLERALNLLRRESRKVAA